MKITITIITTAFLCLANLCYSQDYVKNVFAFSNDIGYSSDLSSSKTYNSFSGVGQVLLDSKKSAVTGNTSFSYTRFLDQRNGLKFLIGRTKFGFNFEGTLIDANTETRGTYRVKYIELGVSYVHKFPLSDFANLLLEPGLRYHSDASTRSTLFLFFDKDSFSFSNYVGVEIPMAGSNVFVNFGLQIKLPLERYNLDFDGNPPYKPFFVGLKVSVNYQF